MRVIYKRKRGYIWLKNNFLTRFVPKGRNDMKIGYKFTNKKGITLIALVVTIIVLLILSRNNDCDLNRRKWNINSSNHSKGENRNSRGKRASTIRYCGMESREIREK